MPLPLLHPSCGEDTLLLTSSVDIDSSASNVVCTRQTPLLQLACWVGESMKARRHHGKTNSRTARKADVDYRFKDSAEIAICSEAFGPLLAHSRT